MLTLWLPIMGNSVPQESFSLGGDIFFFLRPRKRVLLAYSEERTGKLLNIL